MSARGRRPLKPLSPELPEPVAQFTEALRQVYLERTELNQRELAAALHLTKSPVSRYLNGQEVVPAGTFAELCGIAGVPEQQRQHLFRLRERAEAASRAGGAADEALRNAGTAEAPHPDTAPEPAETDGGRDGSGRDGSGGDDDPRARSRAAFRRSAPAAGAAVLLVAAAVLGVQALAPDGDGEPRPGDRSRAGAPGTASAPSGGSCRPTRVYRVLEDGDILDGEHNDIGDVRADDLFGLDDPPASSPYRYRDYGHVAGSKVVGYVDQAKLKPLGRRCLQPDPR
ncbi:helix-turn-helix domain-containing protein [Streptomyces daqingensis]|uniref:helix-turn-helix domain-containing protein n=1 Tax=Streptomyces daqingensis TaxID=1472640 RepID=UPI001668C66A|nr:helix-turn-helix transcriptional regulator [Streptomyces daqingensis]